MVEKPGIVADVVDMPVCTDCGTVVPPTFSPTVPVTSQSPAVKLIEVTLAQVPVVSATAAPVSTTADITSPTLPACALLLVFVPTMPAVWFGVMVLDAVSAVTVSGAKNCTAPVERVTRIAGESSAPPASVKVNRSRSEPALAPPSAVLFSDRRIRRLAPERKSTLRNDPAVPATASVLNVPAAAVVPPIAGGEASQLLKPVPLIVEVALSVVKAPAAGAVPPIAGGEASQDVKPRH
jgi:hypothetical protein